MALRHEAAQLLGFANAAEESLATKMAETPERVLHFLQDLTARAKPVAERESRNSRLRDARVGIDTLQPWDVAYASEKLRIERYALGEEELKPYFPLERVLAGLHALTERVFGVKLVERTGVDLWHADARCFDLLDAAGDAFAVVYFDLFARSGKRGGAWMDVARSRKRICAAAPARLPDLQLRAADGRLPSLLTHDDVLTLFHEFGHGLHHMLTEIDYPSLSGIEGRGMGRGGAAEPVHGELRLASRNAGSGRGALADRRAVAAGLVRSHARGQALPGRPVPGAPARVRACSISACTSTSIPARGACVLETLAAVRARCRSSSRRTGSGFRTPSPMSSRAAMRPATTAICGPRCCRPMRSRASRPKASPMRTPAMRSSVRRSAGGGRIAPGARQLRRLPRPRAAPGALLHSYGLAV
jgi:hypothetical protein